MASSIYNSPPNPSTSYGRLFPVRRAYSLNSRTAAHRGTEISFARVCSSRAVSESNWLRIFERCSSSTQIIAFPGMLYGKVAASSDGRNSDLVRPLGLLGGPRPWIESVSIDSDVVLRNRYGESADLPVSACIVATVSKTLLTAEYQVSVVIASIAG